MNPLLKGSSADVELQARAMSADERRLEQLIDRLPSGFRSAVRSLRRPSGRWLRIPAGGIADVWRGPWLPANRWILDASNRLGAYRR